MFTTADKKRILSTARRGEFRIGRTNYRFEDINRGEDGRLKYPQSLMMVSYKKSKFAEDDYAFNINVNSDSLEVFASVGGVMLRSEVLYENIQILWAHTTRVQQQAA